MWQELQNYTSYGSVVITFVIVFSQDGLNSETSKLYILAENWTIMKYWIVLTNASLWETSSSR